MTAKAKCACGRDVHSRGKCYRCYRRAIDRGEMQLVAPHKVSPMFDGVIDTSGERCKCGLRKPCNDCLPTSIVQYMERMDRPSNWPERPV